MFFEMEKDNKYADVWYNNKVVQSKSIHCPKDPGHRRGIRTAWSISVELKSKKLADFMSTVFDWLVTDEVAKVLESKNLTGYELRPVDVCNEDLKPVLWELHITGKGGDAHPDSGIVVKSYCEACGSIKYTEWKSETGIIVDENNWDGSDFFTITGYPNYVLVHPRVKSIIEEYRWTGVEFIPSTQLKNFSTLMQEAAEKWRALRGRSENS